MTIVNEFKERLNCCFNKNQFLDLAKDIDNYLDHYFSSVEEDGYEEISNIGFEAYKKAKHCL